MRQMNTKFIRQCDICQKTNTRRREVHVQHYVTLTGTVRMKERSVDLTMNTSIYVGHKYTCVMIDYIRRRRMT